MLGRTLLLLLTLLGGALAAGDELPPGEVARVDGVPIPEEEFHRYAGVAFARQPEGDATLRQLLAEGLVRRLAQERGVSVGALDLEALAARLGTRTTDPARGEELRRALVTVALQERLARQDLGLAEDAPLDDEPMRAWLEARLAETPLQESPLEDARAATWANGTILREDVGRSLLATLPENERAALLTELIGIQLVEAAARREGLAFTEEAAAAELDERERAVRANPQTADLTYVQVLNQVEHRSLEELRSSRRFQAEVLLRRLSERAWNEPALRGLFAEQRGTQGWGPTVSFSDALPLLLREARRRTYHQLFRDSTIVRRF